MNMDELDATVTSWLGLPYPPTPVMHMRVPLMGTLGYLTGLALLLAWRRKAVIPSDGDPNGTVVWSPGAGTLVPVSVQPIFKMVQVVHNIGLSLFSLASRIVSRSCRGFESLSLSAASTSFRLSATTRLLLESI